MRVLGLAGLLVVWIVALVALWQHRYERVPSLPGWSLADLRSSTPPVVGAEWQGTGDASSIRLRLGPQVPHVSMRLALPGATAVDSLYIRFRMHARGLVQGSEKWQTGRFIIEWHQPGSSGAPELDPIAGVHDEDVSTSAGIVAVPAQGPAVPALRLEHLGRAGEMVLSDLEIVPVRERAIWRYGRYFLAAAFMGWIYLSTRLVRPVSHMRCLLAAGLWLGMGLHFVVPGPWKIQYPLLVGFRLDQTADGGASSARFKNSQPLRSALEIQSGEVSASGHLLPQGTLALRVKTLLALARPLLHVLLLLAPTLASAWLIGRRSTLAFAVLFALAVEASQVAFGYGFDWIDVADLLTDSIGIAMGLWLAIRIPQFVKTKLGPGKVRFEES